MGRHRVVRETVAVDVDEYVVADDQSRCVGRFDTREEAQERHDHAGTCQVGCSVRPAAPTWS